MAVLTHHRHRPRSPWPARLVGFLAGSLVGVALAGVLTLYVWPLLYPFADTVIPTETGQATAVVLGLLCGAATAVMTAARQASRR